MKEVKEHIYDMAHKMEQAAKSIRRMADTMEKLVDIDYTQDVMNEVANLQIDLKLPVFISRTIKASAKIETDKIYQTLREEAYQDDNYEGYGVED